MFKPMGMDPAGLSVDLATATNEEVLDDIAKVFKSGDLEKIQKLMPQLKGEIEKAMKKMPKMSIGLACGKTAELAVYMNSTTCGGTPNENFTKSFEWGKCTEVGDGGKEKAYMKFTAGADQDKTAAVVNPSKDTSSASGAVSYMAPILAGALAVASTLY